MFLVLLNLALHFLASHKGVTIIQETDLVVASVTFTGTTQGVAPTEPSHPP